MDIPELWHEGPHSHNWGDNNPVIVALWQTGPGLDAFNIEIWTRKVFREWEPAMSAFHRKERRERMYRQ